MTQCRRFRCNRSANSSGPFCTTHLGIPWWKEQLRRAERYYARYDEIRNSDVPDADHAALPGRRDDVYTVFLHLYHLKDWLLQDKSYRGNRCQRGNRCKSPDCAECRTHSGALQICKDVCNAVKHLIPQREGFIPSMHLHVSIGGRQDGQVLDEYFVTVNGTQHDAFDVATDAISSWRQLVMQRENLTSLDAYWEWLFNS